MNKSTVLVFAFATLFSVACASGPTQVVTNPPGAFVKVNDQNLGVAPVSHTFVFSGRPTQVVLAEKPGYFTEQVSVSKETPGIKKGQLQIVLQEDEAYRATTTSEATNQWLRVQVSTGLSEAAVWQKLVDSVTGRYTSLEQLDNSSGYMRSVYTVRKFKGRDADYSVRSRLIGSISSRDPLVYKVKIESESFERGDWVPYQRVFKEDAQLIEEIQQRLGIK